MQQDRDATLQAFDRRNSVALNRRHEEEVRAVVHRLQFFIRDKAVEVHAVGDAERACEGSEFAQQRAFAS